MIETANAVVWIKQNNSDVTSVHSFIQQVLRLNLFDIIDQKIEYLFNFREDNEMFYHWCVGIVWDVSNGADNSK